MNADGLPFHQGVGSYGKIFPTHTTYCSVDGRVANSGDILFSVRAPVGRLNIADQKLIIGRGLSAMRHKHGLQYYLYQLLKNSFSSEDMIGNGAIFNSVSKSELKQFSVYEPTEELTTTFNGIIEPIDRQIQVLDKTNQNLTKTRDLLLPRLISGKLSVEGLDIQFPPSMEE